MPPKFSLCTLCCPWNSYRFLAKIFQEHSMILCSVMKNQIPLSYQKEGGRQEALISHEGLYKVTAFKLHNIPEFYKDSAVHRHCVIVKVTQLL